MPRAFAAIALGALLGYALPLGGVRVLKTFNVLFAQFLKFIVPLLVLGLVIPAITDVGKGAGKMLLAIVFKTLLQSAYSRLPHDWAFANEREVKRYFLAFMIFAGADVVGEEQHATGRPDAVLRTEKGIYVFEFKFDKSAAEAIRQCRDRNYAAAFADDARPVHYIGVNYNSTDTVRTTDDVACERA